MMCDSGDEWLEELLRCPPDNGAQRSVVAQRPPVDSDDEWLDELSDGVIRFVRPLESDEEWLEELSNGSIRFGQSRSSSDGGEPHGREPPLDSRPRRQLGQPHGRGPPLESRPRRQLRCFSAVGQPDGREQPPKKRPRGQQPSSSINLLRFEPIECNGDEGAMLENLQSHAREVASTCVGVIYDRDLISYLSRGQFPFTLAWLDLVAEGMQGKVRDILSGRGLVVFKIGISAHAPWRMFNQSYGYAVSGERYDRMDLLVASFPAPCAYLERALIAAFRGTLGCRNDAPGGESAPKEGLCFVYLVSLPEAKMQERLRSKASRKLPHGDGS